ncbi:hypothetical protein [Butyrivibrio sp. LC3010]|uniref:hypothetical protein n=1 Tax=Butyrivibrio sp. LC3010 TaxID=1280680 RepID=UPI0003F59E97|nr:hypothetical protein [Butyrivibrio sp. LC3010]
MNIVTIWKLLITLHLGVLLGCFFAVLAGYAGAAFGSILAGVIFFIWDITDIDQEDNHF